MERYLLYSNMMKVAQRLPDHYKIRYKEFMNADVKSHHIMYEKGNWKRIEGTDKIYPMKCFNIPPQVIYPPEMDKGLFAGEGIVVGMWKRHDQAIYKVPRTWRPSILEELFHSEILDRYMMIILTMRAAICIEKAGGFDEYIIKTPDAEIKSRLGLHLKREMLMKLADKESLYPDDIPKRDMLLNKYKDYIIPKSEASWIGYSLSEAIFRQMKIEHDSIDRTPHKIKYLKEVADKIKSVMSEKT